MMSTQCKRKLAGAGAALLLALSSASPLGAQPAADQRSRPSVESVNEEALFRSAPRIDGRISIPDVSARILEQPQGRSWRQFHERWVPWIAGVAILGMALALTLFLLLRGRIRLEEADRSRATIIRFDGFERFTHWTVATSFILLALTGLNYIFGKRLLMPLIGPAAFGEASQWAKYVHNFVAWPFMLGLLIMGVMWARDNAPRRVDLAWLKSGGGLFRRSPAPVSAGRFNAGQKIMFWGVIVAGLVMSGTGLALLFPLRLTDIGGMQWASGIHSLLGVVFFASILAHIYIGSIGMEGAFRAMGEGEVDLAWAQRHHDLWVAERQGAAPVRNAAGPAPARAPDRAT
jgi:formate dehydrogenase subunit gamma